MEIEWQESFDTIKIKHDEAYKTIEVARKHDEASNAELALLNYKLSMEIIDEALLTPVALPDETDDLDETWHLALEMIQKMKRTRAELIRRIGILSPSTSNQNNFVDKNGDSNTEHVVKERPRTFLELAEALQNFEYDFNSDELPTVLELLFLCEGVKLYHINVHGEVTTADELSTLRIIRLDQDLTQKLEATYFMQIIRSSATTTIQIDESLNGIDNNIENDISCTSLPKQTNEKADISIIYPLVPGVSPCFRTDYGAFIFPDIESDVAGAAFGLVIPSGTDQIVLEILEAILHGVVRQSVPEEVEKEEEEEEEEGEFTRKRARRAVSEKISENLVHGACFISNGLVKGSEQVGKFVSFTTPYIISKLNKAPENSPPVSNKVIGSVEMAKSATSMAVNVTGYVAGKVGVATMALGRFLAPHVHAQGSKLLSSAMGISSDEATNKMGGVLVVAAGAVEGFGTVYTGLEKSAAILGNNLSNNSVKIIEHKYGPSAGSVAADTLDTVGNMINLSKNVNYITPKGLAKKTVKSTGKAIFTDYKPKMTGTSVPAGALYPDLTEFSKQLAKPKF